MTDQEQRECNCGAVRFGPAAAHLPECYVMLAADAEATQGVPVRDLSQPGERRALVDPGAETEFCKIRFVPGLEHPAIESYNTDGKPSIIQAGRISGKLIGVREIDTNYGPGTAFDLKIQSDNPQLHDVIAGCFASSMLKRLIQQVRIGSNIEIARVPSTDRKAHL